VSLFKRRRFPVEIILLCVRWYCKYGISYRDLAEMMSVPPPLSNTHSTAKSWRRPSWLPLALSHLS